LLAAVIGFVTGGEGEERESKIAPLFLVLACQKIFV